MHRPITAASPASAGCSPSLPLPTTWFGCPSWWGPRRSHAWNLPEPAKNRQNQCKSLLEARFSATKARVSYQNSTKRFASAAFFRILLGRFRFAARRLRCRRRAWRRGNGPAKHLDSIAVSIKLTQCHYVCDGGILAFLIETVFAARIETCCSILGNDLSQCGYSPLMSGDYDASAHFGVSISHTINMGAREAGRHRK